MTDRECAQTANKRTNQMMAEPEEMADADRNGQMNVARMQESAALCGEAKREANIKCVCVCGRI